MELKYFLITIALFNACYVLYNIQNIQSELGTKKPQSQEHEVYEGSSVKEILSAEKNKTYHYKKIIEIKEEELNYASQKIKDLELQIRKYQTEKPSDIIVSESSVKGTEKTRKFILFSFTELSLTF
jgi:hypothetical protein